MDEQIHSELDRPHAMGAWEIDRGAVVEMFRKRNLDALQGAVASGDWTQDEADRAHQMFMASDLLQALVTSEVTALAVVLNSMEKGRDL